MVEGSIGQSPNTGSGLESFYPLDPGACWRYTRRYREWFTPADGSGARLRLEFVSRIERRAVCVEYFNGRAYVVETVTEHGESDSRTNWNRLRQDRFGLYRWQIGPSVPPSCSAGLSPAVAGSNGPSGGEREPRGGVSGEEAPILRYPVHPGATWAVTPGLTRVVEGTEVLSLPAGRFVAFRIREEYGEGSANGPVHVWYGRAGFLQLRGHSKYVLTDEEARPFGTVESEFSEVLDRYIPGGG